MNSVDFWLISPLVAAIAISIGIIIFIDKNTRSLDDDKPEESTRERDRTALECPSPITTSDTAALINRKHRQGFSAEDRSGSESDEPVPDSPAQIRESDSGTPSDPISDGDSDVAPEVRGEADEDESEWDHVHHADAELDEGDKPLAEQKIVQNAELEAKKFIEQLRQRQDSSKGILSILRDFSAHFRELSSQHENAQVRSALTVAVCNGLIDSDGLNLLNSIASDPDAESEIAAEAKKIVEAVVPLVWQK